MERRRVIWSAIAGAIAWAGEFPRLPYDFKPGVDHDYLDRQRKRSARGPRRRVRNGGQGGRKQ